MEPKWLEAVLKAWAMQKVLTGFINLLFLVLTAGLLIIFFLTAIKFSNAF